MSDSISFVPAVEFAVVELTTGRKFKKQFDSPYKARKYMNKVRYSKKVRIISVSGNLG